MNSCTFVGRLGRDSELKNTDKGEVLSFSLASDTGFKDNKKTLWLDCSLWGKRATALSEYLKKGTEMTVVGQLSERSYTDKEGSEKKALQFNVAEILRFSTDNSAQAERPQQSSGGMDDSIPF